MEDGLASKKRIRTNDAHGPRYCMHSDGRSARVKKELRTHDQMTLALERHAPADWPASRTVRTHDQIIQMQLPAFPTNQRGQRQRLRLTEREEWMFITVISSNISSKV